MLPVFLLGFTRELARQELHRTHRRDEVVYVVLCEVSAIEER